MHARRNPAALDPERLAKARRSRVPVLLVH